MNLHEECLLKYLKFPDGISTTTEILKLNNRILEKEFLRKHAAILPYALNASHDCAM